VLGSVKDPNEAAAELVRLLRACFRIIRALEVSATERCLLPSALQGHGAAYPWEHDVG
jgi:hypothetical protein